MTTITTKPADPPWVVEARRFMGLREIVGAKHSPVILGWATSLKGWVAKFYRADETPWCGLAVAHWITVSLPLEAIPANPLGALNWASFGVKLDAPAVGAVLAFQRPGGGHVGLYVGEDATRYYVLGGNQGNSVCISPVLKSRCVAIRWPTTYPRPETGRVLMAGGKTSKNEA